MKIVLGFFAASFMAVWAFAQETLPVVIPDADPLMKLLELISTAKAMTPLAIGMVVVVIVFQLLKKYFGDFKYKRLVNVALSCVYGIGLALVSGLSPLQAIVGVLVTSGGAMALYDAYVGLKKATGIEA